MSRCPPDDRLASLVDGRADATERAALLAHVSECADCYEVFTETARWQQSAEAAEPAGEPAPVASLAEARRRRTFAPTWLAAAAAVVVALTAAVLIRPSSDPAAQQVAGGPATPAVTPTPTAAPVPVPSTATVAARLPGWLTAAPWGTQGASQAFAPRETAFVLGLHGAALERAAAIPDADARRSAVEWIRKSLRARMTIDADAETRFSTALAGQRIEPFAVAARDKGRRDLAAFVEAWRIDVFEHRRGALSIARADTLARYLAAARMDDELRIPTETLRAQLAGPSPAFDDVGAVLADLIEAIDS
jgi:hypothetical protein